ncbi:DUF418 domain-containing protein [Humidisolicoccus flavus]|uniref:DUF418 domain-containing protein n=1 Tax=Humidisolicoccus flavus TaxID=3111414 RepID=UPI00325031C8
MNNTTVLPPGAFQSAQSPGARIAALDVARGIAILGTLGTNIWLFSHPWGLLGILSEPVTDETSGLAAHAQLVLMALTQGKFLALLTLMFGMGMALQHRSTVRRHGRWPGRYLWRAALLFLDGLINYILIAEFDVLMGYAVTGAIVAWLLLTRPRTQRTLIVVFGSLHVLLISAIAAVVLLAPSSDDGMTSSSDLSPYANSSFFELALFRLDNLVLFRAEPVLIGFLSIAMFLLGAKLLHAGVFAPEGQRLRRRLIWVGATAVPIDLALGIFGGTAGMLVERYVVAPFVALGLLALIAEVCIRRPVGGWWSNRVSELGRVALSAYLLQNLLAGAIFYGWGFGLAAAVGEWRVLVTVAAFLLVSIIVVTAANLWLRKFRLGPMEWLWAKGSSVSLSRRRQ